MLNKICNYLFSLFFSIFNIFLKKKKNRYIFGAWFGERYSDNPKYLAEYLIENYPQSELIWIGKAKIKPNISKEIKFVEMNTIKSLYYIATAEFIFLTHGYRDVCRYDISKKNKRLIQLWHGVPLKKINDDMPNTMSNFFNWIYTTFNKGSQQYAAIISSSTYMDNCLKTAFKSAGITESNIITSGQPRNDFMINNTTNVTFKNNIKTKYKITPNKKIITYMPTFRDNSNDVFTFSKVDFENLFGDECIIIEKSHFISEQRNNTTKENLIDGSKFDTQELLLITDMLITDYSSCYFDYSLLKKPIIHFAYDYEYYKNDDRGTYTDLNVATPGKIVYTEEELLEQIHSFVRNELTIRNNVEFEECYINYEKGTSCKIICNELLGK